MATMITEECINCGACEPECPNQAISQAEDIYVIDPVLCTECVGFHDVEQCAAVCPVDCCVADPNNPEEESLLVARARQIHPDTEILEDFPSRFRTSDGAAPSVSAESATAVAEAPADGGGTATAVAEAPADGGETATAVAEAPADGGGTATAVAEAPASTEEAPALQPTVSPAVIKMITPQLKTFLENKMGSGDEVTIQVKKDTFTGRIYRLMLDEGWIAMESVDGRRRALYVITGGKITTLSGEEVTLPA